MCDTSFQKLQRSKGKGFLLGGNLSLPLYGCPVGI